MATNSPETDSGIETKLTEEEKKFYNEVKPQTGYDLSIFMVGITGAGKSAFCNFLANEKVFVDGGGFMSVSQGGACCRFQFNSEDVLVIDSPGFCDSIREDCEIFNELCKIGVIAKDGTDAVAVVVNGLERFSDNHRKAFTMMEQMGGSFWKHAFIVFTNESETLRRNNVKTPKEYIDHVSKDKKCPPILKEMLLKTENRYIFVDSIGCFQNEEYRNDKCNQIFQFIHKIREINNNARYSNTIMLQGQKFFEERQESDNKLKELEETLKRRDKEMEDERARVKKEEERRIREAEESERLMKEETEKMKKENERLKMKFEMEKDAEKREKLQKEMHDSEISGMKSKILNLEKEKETEKERRMEAEAQLRHLQQNKELERERKMAEQERESRAVEYKQNVAKEAEKDNSWGAYFKSFIW